jgi:hypothetical protein
MGRLADKVVEHMSAELDDGEEVVAALAANGFSLTVLVAISAGGGALAAALVDAVPTFVGFLVGYVITLAVASIVLEIVLRRLGRFPGSMWLTLVATTRGLLVVRNRPWSTTPQSVHERIPRGAIRDAASRPGTLVAPGRLQIAFADGLTLKVYVGARVDPATFRAALLQGTDGTS